MTNANDSRSTLAIKLKELSHGLNELLAAVSSDQMTQQVRDVAAEFRHLVKACVPRIRAHG